MSNLAKKLTKHDTTKSTAGKGYKAKNYDLQCIYVQERLSTCGSTYRCSKKDYYDVHKCVGSCLRKLFNNSGLTEQVSEHQHTNKWSCCRKDQANNDCDNDREKDLLKFCNRTKLRHFDLTLFLCCERLHDRRLDDRYQRHIRICCYCDRSHKRRLSKLTCKENGSRAISTTDDRDRCCCFSVESKENCKEVCKVNTKLCSCSHQEADRVCDQRTEVCHRTDTQEDQ